MSAHTDSLLNAVYEELRRLAAYHLTRERPEHSLQATALVHEAYLRLAGQENSQWQDRTQFVAVASQMMRRVLVDHARSRLREKRGGGREKISLSEASELAGGREVEVLDLDGALGIWPRSIRERRSWWNSATSAGSPWKRPRRCSARRWRRPSATGNSRGHF
jgi:RNA polymerase sigma factor (TIGR02999 family)